MKRVKHFLALVSIFVLALMYVMTLFAAFFDDSKSLIFFKISLALTIFIPCLLWILGIFIRISGNKGKKDKAKSMKTEENFSDKR